ncbi:MAG: CARDB domain-containing protein [Planctomycetota bacterium]
MPKGEEQAAAFGVVPAVFEPLEQRTLLAGDLAGLFDSFENPTQLAGARVELDVFISNNGSSNISGTLEVDFYASRDGTLNTAVDPFISREKVRGRLAPGQGDFVTFTVDAPLSLEAGNWRVIAVLNPDNTLAESNTSNNTLVSQVGTLIVPDYDLAGALDDLKFPSAIITGNEASGTARVLVSNEGTFAVAKTAAVDVRVYAREVSEANTASVLNGDILIGEASAQKLGGLKPGSKAKVVNVKLATDDQMPIGNYKLVVVVDSGGDLAESDESNNVEVLSSETFRVSPPFAALDVGVSPKAKLPPAVVSGDGTKIKLPITVENSGNVPLENGQTFDIQVFADRDGGGSTLLTTLDDASISKLAPGKPKAFNLNVLLPAGLGNGDYTLRVVIDASGDVPQLTTAGNTARTAEAIQVAAGFVTTDLGLAKLSVKPILTGSVGKGTASLEVTNNGNVAHPRNERLDLLIALRPTGGAANGSDDILVGTAPNALISGLKPGKTKKINVKLLMPASLDADNYTVVAAQRSATGTPITEATDLGAPDPIGNARVLVTDLAPSSIGGKRADYKIKSGSLPFASRGSGRITYSTDGTYIRAEKNGVTTTGTYIYTQNSFSTGTIVMNDVELSQFRILLEFSKIDQADYVIEGLAFGGAQSGSIKITLEPE